MRFYFLTLATALLSFSSSAYAQVQDGLDVVLGYNDLSNPTEIVLTAMDGVTANSIPYYIDFFGIPDPFLPDDFATDDPGFITNADSGLLINEDDQLYVQILDASANQLAAGVGYVNFYNPDTDQLEASGRLSFDRTLGSQDELVLDGDTVTSGETLRDVDFGRISIADSSGFGIHQHLMIDLLDDATAPPGAYGVLMELQSDFFPNDGEMDLISEPFWVIWNHRLSGNTFLNSAVPAFINATAAPALGDFDGDGDVDLADLDRYIGNLNMAAVGNLAILDLNSDGVVDSVDFEQHYEQLVETSNGVRGTFAGDINLDGTVDVLGDAFILVGSLGSSVTSWGDGDLNGDEVVDVLGDAFLLVGNLGNSNETTN